MWDPNQPTHIEVNTSGFAMGGILLQWLNNDLWHPVAYRLKSMADTKHNYEIYDKEMLAIIWALKDWRHYLEGLPDPFTIITDHQNLQFWCTTQNLTHRQACWSLYLSWFDFCLTYKHSSINTQADPLSHFSTHAKSDSDDNINQIVLHPKYFATAAASLAGNLNNIEEQICNTTELNHIVTHALCLLRQHAPQ